HRRERRLLRPGRPVDRRAAGRQLGARGRQDPLFHGRGPRFRSRAGRRHRAGLAGRRGPGPAPHRHPLLRPPIDALTMQRSSSFALTITLVGSSVALAACNGDDGSAEAAESTDSGDGDGDPGDGDGDPGDGDPGDGDPGGGDPGDGDGDDESPCAWQGEAMQLKANGQTHAGFDVAVATDGKLAVVGKIESQNDDAWVAMLDSTGRILWEQVVDGGNGPDAAVGVTLDQAGDVVLVGRQAGSDNQD